MEIEEPLQRQQEKGKEAHKDKKGNRRDTEKAQQLNDLGCMMHGSF